MRTAVIFGGVNQHHQVKALKAGVDILIATPGRLLDLCNQRHIRLDKVSHPRARRGRPHARHGLHPRRAEDRCRSAGSDRQTLLFSATMPPPIAKLAADILDNPVRIDIAPPRRSPSTASSSACYFVGAKEKRALLESCSAIRRMDRVLVFTRTKHGADRVCRYLTQAGIATAALHGNKAQNARVRALDAFRNGKVRILVATDIAARGIDVPNISHVINYELPNEPESYVHRIGRTARAGAGGAALSFCDQSERPYLQAIERLMRSTVSVGEHRLAVTPATPATPPAPHKPRPHGKAPAAGKRRRRPNGRGFAGLPRAAQPSSRGERAHPLRGDLR